MKGLVAGLVAVIAVGLSSAAPAVAAGDSGGLVTVAERQVKVEPGAGFDLTLMVRNDGPSVAHVAYAEFTNNTPGNEWLRATKKFSNCRYYESLPSYCEFDQDLVAGATYRAVAPMRMPKDQFAPSTYPVTLDWSTSDPHPDPYPSGEPDPAGELGTDGVLVLERVPEPDGLPYAGSRTTYQVHSTGNHPIDYEVIGARASGPVGKYLAIHLVLRNNGPASLRNNVVNGSLQVRIPPGAEVQDIPRDCVPVKKAGRDLSEFRCSVLARDPGQISPYDFELRITKRIPDAVGYARLVWGSPGKPFTGDNNKDNNEAAIVLNGTGGDGGSLPRTGPAGAAAGGAGIALLLGGAVAILVTRRRRTHFKV